MVVPKFTEQHEAAPVAESWYEERTQHPANLRNSYAYPVIAVCTSCGCRIRLEHIGQLEWRHVPLDG